MASRKVSGVLYAGTSFQAMRLTPAASHFIAERTGVVMELKFVAVKAAFLMTKKIIPHCSVIAGPRVRVAAPHQRYTARLSLLEEIMRFLHPHAERIYALFRIIIGLMFMQHGLQKVFGLFGGMPPGVPAFIIYGAGSIELGCGALVVLGLFAAPAAFLASGTMAFAFFLGHAIPNKNLIPIVNQGELAVIYCFAFLYIATHGAGIWSADAARRGAKS